MDQSYLDSLIKTRWFNYEDISLIGKNLIAYQGFDYRTQFEVIGSLEQLDKHLSQLNEHKFLRGPLFIIYEHDHKHWFIFMIVLINEKIWVLHKDTHGESMKSHMEEIIHQRLKPFRMPIEILSDSNREQLDGTSCGPMSLRNLDVLIGEYKIDKHKLVERFKNKKIQFCSQADVKEVKEVFKRLLSQFLVVGFELTGQEEFYCKDEFESTKNDSFVLNNSKKENNNCLSQDFNSFYNKKEADSPAINEHKLESNVESNVKSQYVDSAKEVSNHQIKSSSIKQESLKKESHLSSSFSTKATSRLEEEKNYKALYESATEEFRKEMQALKESFESRMSSIEEKHKRSIEETNNKRRLRDELENQEKKTTKFSIPIRIEIVKSSKKDHNKKSSNLISLTVEKENNKRDWFEIPVNCVETESIRPVNKPVSIPVENCMARSVTELRKNAWKNSGYIEEFPIELDLEKSNSFRFYNRKVRLVFDNLSRKDLFF